MLPKRRLQCILKKNICIKGAAGSCIDLQLTNSKYNFQYSKSIETGLSDHHHLIVSIMRTNLTNEEPKRLVYRNFKSFNY